MRNQTIGGLVSFLLLIGVALAYTSGNCSVAAGGSIYVGEAPDVTISVFNHASASLSDLTITVTIPAELGGNRVLTLPTLGGRSLYTSTFPLLMPNATTGAYTLSAKVKFQNIEENLDPCTVFLSQMPISVEASVDKGALNPGEEGRLTVSVRNTGSATLKDTNISLKMPFGFSTNESSISMASFLPAQEVKKDYIYKASIGAAPGDYHVTVGVDFFDEAGGRHHFSRDVAVSVAGGGLGLLETILLILVAVLALRLVWGMVGG